MDSSSKHPSDITEGRTSRRGSAWWKSPVSVALVGLVAFAFCIIGLPLLLRGFVVEVFRESSGGNAPSFLTNEEFFLF